MLAGQRKRKMPLAAVRRRVAVVSQDTFLFNTSVRENIAYGDPGASEAEIRAAAERAGATELIASLPAGWNTPCGDRGVRLSGGQRQRIAIARAFLKNAPFLVLEVARVRDRERRRREREHAREDVVERDASKRPSSRGRDGLEMAREPAGRHVGGRVVRRPGLHRSHGVEVAPRRIGRAAGVDERQPAGAEGVQQRGRVRVQPEVAVEVQRAVRHAGRIDGERRARRVQPGVAVRDDDRQAVDRAA